MKITFVVAFVAVAGLLFLLDWYVFQGVRSLTNGLKQEVLRKTINGSFWVVNWGLPAFIAAVYLQYGRMTPWFTIPGSLFITLLVSKLFVVSILAGGDLLRAIEGIFRWISGNGTAEVGFMPERRRFVSQLAFGVAALPFTSFLYGMTKGKYKYKVHRHTLYFPDLPEAFDGFTITQLSDIHAGSFDDRESVMRGVELVNKQKSDLFVFTGDLVNATADEFVPWVEVFKTIRAPYGQYSILGNHDYGDYHFWDTKAAKKANFQQLLDLHNQTGFRLLRDEHILLTRHGQQIAVAGVENWGIGFGKRGNLRKALEGLNEDTFKILLSHDPTHWDQEVKHFPSRIALTLSGHTHGMQMGVEMRNLRWSPSRYRYPKWAGVYEEEGRYLNVNRGFGFLGFSGRVGIWPEITVIELRRGKQPAVRPVG